MAVYILNKNEKARQEEKQIHQLGGRSQVKRFTYGRMIKKTSAIITVILFITAFVLIFGGIPFSADISGTGLKILMAVFIFIIVFNVAVMLLQKKSVCLSPDIKQMADSYGVERLEITQFGVIHIFLSGKDTEDSEETYTKKYITKENITEILRCEALGMYIFCGKTFGYITKTDKIFKKDPDSVNWEISVPNNQTSLRVYDYWDNEATGVNDIKSTIKASFDIPVREVSAEEAMEVIRKDDKAKEEYRNLADLSSVDEYSYMERGMFKRLIRESSILLGIFAVITAVFIGFMVFANIDIRGKMSRMVQTRATVVSVKLDERYNVDIDERENPEVSVEYIYNGKPYVVKSDNSDSSLKIGEEIDFWYDPDDPYNVTAGKATLNGLNMILSGFIIVFGAFTIIMIRKVIFYIRKRNEYF